MQFRDRKVEQGAFWRLCWEKVREGRGFRGVAWGDCGAYVGTVFGGILGGCFGVVLGIGGWLDGGFETLFRYFVF